MGAYVLPVRVYLEDTDAQGVVYNASYVRFFERARTEWLRSRGIDHNELRETANIALVLSRIDVRFRAPARLDDMLEVSAEVTESSAVRFVFEQSVRRAMSDGDESLCRARAVVACVDSRNGKPRRLPADFLSGVDKDVVEVSEGGRISSEARVSRGATVSSGGTVSRGAKAPGAAKVAGGTWISGGGRA